MLKAIEQTNFHVAHNLVGWGEVVDDHVVIYDAGTKRSHDYRWRRVAGNNAILSESSEGYKNLDWAISTAIRCNSTVNAEKFGFEDGEPEPEPEVETEDGTD